MELRVSNSSPELIALVRAAKSMADSPGYAGSIEIINRMGLLSMALLPFCICQGLQDEDCLVHSLYLNERRNDGSQESTEEN